MGGRSRQVGEQLLSVGFEEVHHLAGGIEAWKAAGLPVQRGEGPRISLQRQVQIAAGSLVMGGLLLGFLSPWFHLISGLVGAGLLYAGATGRCGMTTALSRLWLNRTDFHHPTRPQS